MTTDELRKLQQEASGTLKGRENGRPSKMLLVPVKTCISCSHRIPVKVGGKAATCDLVGKSWTKGRDVQPSDPACIRYEANPWK